MANKGHSHAVRISAEQHEMLEDIQEAVMGDPSGRSIADEAIERLHGEVVTENDD